MSFQSKFEYLSPLNHEKIEVKHKLSLDGAKTMRESNKYSPLSLNGISDADAG